MVTRKFMAATAMRHWRRSGTLMAWAMLRTLGVPAPPHLPRRNRRMRGRQADLMAIDELMANASSPMDGRR